jgi:hypothetical protein
MLSFQIVGFIGLALFFAALVSSHTPAPTR